MGIRCKGSILLGSTAWSLLLVLALAACKHEPQLEPKVPVGGENPIPTDCDPSTVYFQQQIQPILISNCALPGCHSGPNPANGLDLTNYQGMFDEDVVRPFDLDRDLFEAITEDDPDKIMPPPPQAPLTQDQIDLIAQWIMQGAQNNSCVSSGCDTLNVTYSGTIVPLVQQRCQGCHSGVTPQGGLNLTSYTVMNALATDGRLEAVITHDPFYAPMPPSSPRMPDCEIRKFLIWVEAGAPNN
jgi:uncharacterized membrane protein